MKPPSPEEGEMAKQTQTGKKSEQQVVIGGITLTPEEISEIIEQIGRNRASKEREGILAVLKNGSSINEAVQLFPSFGTWTGAELTSAFKPKGERKSKKGGTRQPRRSSGDSARALEECKVEVLAVLDDGTPHKRGDFQVPEGCRKDDITAAISALLAEEKITKSGEKASTVYKLA